MTVKELIDKLQELTSTEQKLPVKIDESYEIDNVIIFPDFIILE